jgi:hypothetical protein
MDLAQRLGIEHECTCDEDIENGDLELIPACYLRLLDKVIEGYEEMRLYFDAARKVDYGLADAEQDNQEGDGEKTGDS